MWGGGAHAWRGSSSPLGLQLALTSRPGVESTRQHFLGSPCNSHKPGGSKRQKLFSRGPRSHQSAVRSAGPCCLQRLERGIPLLFLQHRGPRGPWLVAASQPAVQHLASVGTRPSSSVSSSLPSPFCLFLTFLALSCSLMPL